MPKRKKKPSNKRMVDLGIGALVAFCAGAAVATVGRAVAHDLVGEETCMLPPGKVPEGEGWTVVNAVTDTMGVDHPIHFVGKPEAMVVWKRRRPREPAEENEPHGLLLFGGGR